MAKKQSKSAAEATTASVRPTGPTVLVGEADSYCECPLDEGSTEGHPLVSVGGLQHARVADSPEGRPIYSRRGAPLN